MDPDDIGNFLSRWSRRKLGKEEPTVEPLPQWKPEPPREEIAEAPAQPGPEALEPSFTPLADPLPPTNTLPPVESLTPESDFKPFMGPDVAPGLKQAAMKQLFKDPHFNVMDGLDTYIADYSVADPIPDEMMKNLYQARQLLWTDEEKAAADAADAAEEANAAEISAALKAGAAAQEPAAPAQEPVAPADAPVDRENKA
jgi:Protein of unknown function (DUF3306)